MSIKLTPSFSVRLLKASQGLSLIELLVTLSIISILLFVGLPSLSDIIKKNQLDTSTQDLLTAIQTTRTLAVMQHKRAVLKANSDWSQGWELFIDDNDNGSRDTEEELLFTQGAIANLSITSTNAMKTISFINTGESRQANGSTGGAFLAGNISICGKKNTKGYKLILARGGRSRISSIMCN
ncbi:MAG: GspH/FimT family pseudopilin [Cellvibrio sp.]|nr:GspH/FimT family pseudopilin [Cellvibrio sp.]